MVLELRNLTISKSIHFYPQVESSGLKDKDKTVIFNKQLCLFWKQMVFLERLSYDNYQLNEKLTWLLLSYH